MASKKIKVLLVDDSSFMRLIISDMLNNDADINVIDTAVNGKEAFEKARDQKPDVVVLDMTMKDYDGIYAVENIMKHCPLPIVILSGLGNSNPQAIFEALDKGAYDFLNKPDTAIHSKIRTVDNDLINKVKTAAFIDIEKLLKSKIKANNNPHTFDKNLPFHIIAIGASTGGSNTIEKLLLKLPANLAVPVIIAQHMPDSFMVSFAKRLDDVLPFSVKIARDQEIIKPGKVYVSPGKSNMRIVKENGKIMARYTEDEYIEYNHPSVDCLMESIAEVYGDKAIAVILTGMGKDGMMGMKKVYEKGGFTIAQDESSSVVFGMPRAAIDNKAIRSVVPLKELPNFIISCF